jgi:hypothetical protein
VLGGSRHQHDGLPGCEFADAMKDRRTSQGPTLAGLGHRPRDLGFGHAGIMFEAQRQEPRLGPDATDETRHRTGRKAFQHRGGVEWLGLDADQDVHDQPPVTGGKNATSSPSPTGSSKRAWVWLTAARKGRRSVNTAA